MIVDAFTFGWELDLLECRLEELSQVVDTFILVEAKETHQGSPKPLYFEENKNRFEKWLPKIQAHIISTFNGVTDETPWGREKYQRSYIKNAVKEFSDDTIVMVSDVDEIPTVKGIKKAANLLSNNDSVCFVQKLYSMAIDWRYPGDWNGTVMTTKRFADTLPSYEHVRSRRMTPPAINDETAGWHFSWLGGEEYIKLKAQSFAHTEDSVQNYVRTMGEKLYTEGYHVLGEKLIPVDIDDTYPKYIKAQRYPTTWLRPR